MARTQEQEEELEIEGMIADTEREIFDDASGKEPDDNDGDRELEKMEGIEGETLDDDGEAAEGDESDEPETDSVEAESADGDEVSGEHEREETQHPAVDSRMVPSHRLREEATARRAAEAEREALKAQIAELRVRQEALEKKSAPAEAKPPKPDMFADPEGYEKWVLEQAEERAMARFQQVEAQRQNERLETSLQAAARGERGYEFQAAYGKLTSLNPQDPQARALVQSIVASPDPANALFDWWDNGDGPEFRENLLAQLQGRTRTRGAAPRQSGQRVRTVTRGPVSLNGAAGQGTHRTIDPDMYDDSEGSIFEYATRR